MISQASKRYEQLHVVRPKNTPDRLRMYHSMEVQLPFRSSSPKRSSFDTIDRETRDSYLLRVTKQIVTNTDYSPQYETIQSASRRQKFAKGAFKRIIGDVRDEDYSLPLIENCDRRCSDAFMTLPHQDTIKTARDVHKYRVNHHNINFQKQISRQKLSESLNLKKIVSNKSTQDSENSELDEMIRKRPKKRKLAQIHDALKKVRNFEHDIGHKYGQQLFTPKKIPQFYDIEKSNASLIKKSMSTPKGNIKFDTFRDQIATRFDRADPNWGMTINYQDLYTNPQNSAKTIDLGKVSQRKPNEVYSKYPIRCNMQMKVPLNK